MKNKKLFAILTLVCFMFTLMPVAAFANYQTDYLTINGHEDVVTVNSTSGATLEVLAASGTTDSYYFFVMNGDNVVGRLPLQATTGTTCAITSEQTLNWAGGTYDVYAIQADPQVTKVLESGASYADKVDTLFADHGYLILDPVTLKVRGAEAAQYNVDVTAWSKNGVVQSITTPGGVATISVNANNGFNNDKVTVTISKVGGSNVKDAVPTFSTAGFVTVTPVDTATGRDGQFDFMVSASRAGEYMIYVTYGGVTTPLKVVANAQAVANVVVAKAPTAPVALDTAVTTANVVFKFTDANGADFTASRGTHYNLTLVSKPADSVMRTEDLTVSAAGSGMVKLGSTVAFDAEGVYEFKAALQSGVSATAKVEVKKFDKVVALEFVKEAPTKLVYNGVTTFSAAQVQFVDANGVTKAVTSPEFSVNGKAVLSFTANTLTAKDEDYIGQTITVYAVARDDKGNTFTASRNIVVVDDAAAIKYNAADLEVGVNNVLYADVFDANGNGVTLTSATPQAIVLEKPENAVVVVAASNATNQINDIKLDLLASVAGEYKVQTFVTYVEGSATKYLSTIDTFVVGATQGAFKDVIVMSIGANSLVKNSEVVAMPAAPEIVDSRTMVPARAGLEAFGAVVVWDEATQTVTAELNGVKVVMEIGEKEYTVNGKTVVGDAAPYITASSTMVPVSFFTNAFGITATPIYDDHGVCDVLFTK